MDERETILSELLPPQRAAQGNSADVNLLAVRGGTGTVAPRVRRALESLLESYNYAHDVGCDVWEFAVELEHLSSLALTASDWRWLCLKGLVNHARELTMPGEANRTFRQGGALRITKRTCFVLTEAGEHYARKLAAEAPLPQQAVIAPSTIRLAEPCSSNGLLDANQLLPTWDRDRQQLRIGKRIVKEFKVPAPNQETLLAAFQEENWAPRIDDPLPPESDIDPKRRLHDTITSLNRNQKEPLIRFLGDGSGQGARWEFTRQLGGNGKH